LTSHSAVSIIREGLTAFIAKGLGDSCVVGLRAHLWSRWLAVYSVVMTEVALRSGTGNRWKRVGRVPGRNEQEGVPEDLKGATLPRHLAVIPDGNGRWARQRGLPRIAGHRAGIESVRDTVRACGEMGIDVLTIYAFSIENWQRPRREISALLGLLREQIRSELKELQKNQVQLRTIGRIDDLPGPVRDELIRAIKETSGNTGLKLRLALSYGGRSEIVDGVRSVARRIKTGELSLDALDEESFRNYLYDPEIPDPDLLIRTSGELRISNFLLWQLAYTEIWVTDVMWPDFRREHLYEAVREFGRRERRYGRVE
jgi:undecaprenyl diphosphate synthase